MAIQDEVRARVDALASELEALVRETALQAVRAALGGAHLARERGGPARRDQAAAAKGQRPTKRGAGEKRPAAELAKLTDKLAAYIKAHPGQRIEQINKAMGVETKELALPVKKLLAAKTIKSKGQKRATTYFPA
jgi:hypothetical protein